MKETVRPRRIALYSHDTQGLGHIRRNIAIASALSGSEPGPAILLVSGVREARSFRLPAGADCVTLPALGKASDGSYGSRHLASAVDELIELRARTITAALKTFAPDVLIVDKVARGQFGELELALEGLRAGGTRIVLGLRDVLDDSARARAEWRQTATTEALEEFYDAVWVYGDPRVYDPIDAYDLGPRVRGMARYTGYLAPRGVVDALPRGLARAADRRFALCLVGGGQDSHRLAEAFCASRLPAGVAGVLVTGPYMAQRDRSRLEAAARAAGDREVLGFVDGCVPLIRRAQAVVAMGGYNTTVELLAHARRALVVPRVRPRLEQLIRAERLAALGALDMCHPDELCPAALTRWIAAAVRDRGARPRGVDLDGLSRLPVLVDSLCSSDRRLSRAIA